MPWPSEGLAYTQTSRFKLGLVQRSVMAFLGIMDDMDDMDDTYLYVGNLPYNTSVSLVQNALSPNVSVIEVKLAVAKTAEAPEGYLWICVCKTCVKRGSRKSHKGIAGPRYRRSRMFPRPREQSSRPVERAFVS